MPESEHHRISLFPRLIVSIILTTGNLSANDEPAYTTVNLKGARPDMFFKTELTPENTDETGTLPILAYCVTNDVIRIAFLGSDQLTSSPITIIAL